ncbi:MAG: hypothetical protein B7Z04_06720 [Rhodobacterales bacterium 32-66-9]|nr:MAG: hypothetical protein B7Z04_06720 [Rhodobacterales bacterium 32-66-9]
MSRTSPDKKKGHLMKKFAAPMLAIALTASAASAGGPVVVAEEPTPVVEAAAPRSGWIVPVVVGAIILCAVACD